MPLVTQQKRYLRGLTHHLRAVVTVAGNGLSGAVIAELDAAFTSHELIKVKLRGDREARKEWIDEISRQLKAERIHVIGQVACFFRRNLKKPIISLPGED